LRRLVFLLNEFSQHRLKGINATPVIKSKAVSDKMEQELKLGVGNNLVNLNRKKSNFS
jgi:hypothetical protein